MRSWKPDLYSHHGRFTLDSALIAYRRSELRANFKVVATRVSA